jgi:hypothetical protein
MVWVALALVGSSVLATVGQTVDAAAPAGVRSGSIVHEGARAWKRGAFAGTRVIKTESGEALALAEGQTEGLYTSPVLDAGLDFIALGLDWLATTGVSNSLTFESRSSANGRAWSDWRAAPPTEEEPGQDAPRSDLFFGPVARYVQYRVTLYSSDGAPSPQVRQVHLTCIDSRSGPTAMHLAALRPATTSGAPHIISRSGWGADERLMTWPPEYQAAQKVIVHHTAGDDGGADPAAMVRAIYYYHAVTRDWGDIGYNYLVDHLGNIYEGRYGGENVIGGHDFQFNHGSIGVSMIGNFESSDVPAPMLRSLTDLLAWKCALHGIDPQGHGVFQEHDLPNILAHRDTNGFTPASTSCPGDRAYALMPTIRSQTQAKLPSIAVEMRVTAPPAGASVRAVVDVTLALTPTGAFSRVDYHVDGQDAYSSTTWPYSWKWNTSEVSNGSHTLRVVAHYAAGQTEDSVRVKVDNAPPNGTVKIGRAHV